MPSLSLPAELAKARFRSFNIQLPDIVAKSGPSGPNVRLTPALAGGGGPVALPLFRPASNMKADVDFQRKMHLMYSDYIDGITKAITSAFDMWRVQAFFKDIVIMGPTAAGGSLEGPPLEPLILAAAPQSPLSAASPAIAKAIGSAWLDTQKSVRVPGLPWYPAFAAFPGPIAPPTPNIPSPFIALIQDPSPTMPATLKQAMASKLKGKVEFSGELFDSIATWFSTAVQTWKAMQMIMLVMGKGPVPTFAPPYVPVGPVVGGDNIAAPGHLMS